jgi:hypothetical protein
MGLVSIMRVQSPLETHRIQIHLHKPASELDFQMIFGQQSSAC